jgi:hypothetical protein
MNQISNPPFILCPYCEKEEFGIWRIYPHFYLRRCNYCGYPNLNRKEPEIHYQLPHLSKKIIYLDQFALSYMVRALHPEMKATGNNNADSFWIELFQKLDKLVKMQIIICPQSYFHLQESIVSNFFEPLEKMYYLLSRGFQFVEQNLIKKQQLRESVLNWLDKSTKHFIADSLPHVFNQDINIWLPGIFTHKPAHYPPNYEDVLRESRERIHQQWIREFFLWKEKRNIKFEQWREDFYLSLIKSILYSRHDYHKFINHLPKQSTSNIELCTFLLESINTIQIIHSTFKEEGINKIEFESNTWDYLKSEYFRQIPFIKLYALVYSSFARKAGSGQKKPPDRGMTNDLNMLSLLLPYCDAMFIDNQCRACLEEKDVLDGIDYETEVFSLNNKEKFLAYLENLEEDFPPEYREKVMELYSKEWINTPAQLYQEKNK